MRQFATILSFELKNYFKNKIFVGITVFLVLLCAAVMFYPSIAQAFESDDGGQSADETQKPVMLVVPEDNADEQRVQSLKQAFESAFAGYEVRVERLSAEQIRSDIDSGRIECAFEITSPTTYTYYVENLSMYDQNSYTADEVLKNLYQIAAMEQQGISAEQANQILTEQITHETLNTGKDQMQNFFYTYIMIFALYMVIIFYGQMVATNAATEKSSRAMELLITSAKPVSMMFGKVIAACIAGLIQLVCVFGSAILFFNLNKAQWQDNQIINSIFNMPVNLLLYMILFFILGFFIYAFMFGATGSMATKLEDVNTLVMPVTLLLVIGFIVVIYSMSSSDMDNIVMKICSYIPFTSPMAMFTRIAMSSVPAYEIIISVAILIGSVIGIGVLAAKIYRVGVLLYGTSPKLGTVLKSVWKA